MRELEKEIIKKAREDKDFKKSRCHVNLHPLLQPSIYEKSGQNG
jgi:hypothetical protein